MQRAAWVVKPPDRLAVLARACAVATGWAPSCADPCAIRTEDRLDQAGNDSHLAPLGLQLVQGHLVSRPPQRARQRAQVTSLQQPVTLNFFFLPQAEVSKFFMLTEQVVFIASPTG